MLIQSPVSIAEIDQERSDIEVFEISACTDRKDVAENLLELHLDILRIISPNAFDPEPERAWRGDVLACRIKAATGSALATHLRGKIEAQEEVQEIIQTA